MAALQPLQQLFAVLAASAPPRRTERPLPAYARAAPSARPGRGAGGRAEAGLPAMPRSPA